MYHIITIIIIITIVINIIRRECSAAAALCTYFTLCSMRFVCTEWFDFLNARWFANVRGT